MSTFTRFSSLVTCDVRSVTFLVNWRSRSLSSVTFFVCNATEISYSLLVCSESLIKMFIYYHRTGGLILQIQIQAFSCYFVVVERFRWHYRYGDSPLYYLKFLSQLLFSRNNLCPIFGSTDPLFIFYIRTKSNVAYIVTPCSKYRNIQNLFHFRVKKRFFLLIYIANIEFQENLVESSFNSQDTNLCLGEVGLL